MLDPRLRTAWLANVAVGAATVSARTPIYLRPATRRTDSIRTHRDSIIASDLEVVTVTADSVILTWTTRTRDGAGRLRPVPADTEVRLAPADGRCHARTRYLDATPTPYHYAEVTGLEPGRGYRFEAYSNGHRAGPARTLVTRQSGTPESTGVFTTAPPPRGGCCAPSRWPTTCTMASRSAVSWSAGCPPACATTPDGIPRSCSMPCSTTCAGPIARPIT
ncbi:hypothetical protein [Nocardia brasiliensis]|uniref:hypothetical protein n=1 Tax=Nocardia brasiliensis TaxID=37326 RepID=UPI003D941F93